MGPARRVAAPLAGVLLSLALLLSTRRLDQVVHGQQLGPGFWPRLVLTGLAGACLAKLVSVLRRDRGSRPREAPSREAPDGGAGISRAKLAAAIALIFLYVLGTEPMGFALSTAGFIVAFMWLCGARSPLVIAANTLVGTAALLYLFVKAVYLPLPKGQGPFEAVTLALYRLLHIF
jgi:putative tricarboxylic transport membrane protein